MEKSDNIKEISSALVKAQTNIGSVAKKNNNPFFKSMYAGLPDVIEACKECLNNEGIVAIQPIQKNYVETILLHTSGQWLSSLTEIIVKKENDPQAYGSGVTYARRYGLESFMLLPSVDDDGEQATDRNNQPNANSKSPKSVGDSKKADLNINKFLGKIPPPMSKRLNSDGLKTKTDQNASVGFDKNTLAVHTFIIERLNEFNKLQEPKLFFDVFEKQMGYPFNEDVFKKEKDVSKLKLLMKDIGKERDELLKKQNEQITKELG